MKNILIINLRRIGDVYTTGHLVNSLAHVEGNTVSLLTYKESAKASVNLKNVSALYQIDRKEIITLKTNKLFSDGFALEQFFIQLQEIKNQRWDEIINYSNDLIGAYICSYLKNSTKKITGVHFSDQKTIIPGGDWEILFNDVLPSVKNAPLHFTDCYHKMAGISHFHEGEKLISNAEYNSSAFSSMSKLRNSRTASPGIVKIIGVQLKTSDNAKDISEETLVELLSLLNASTELVPVLLIAPTDEEREYALLINEKLNNTIAVIEADLYALTSVLMNIDLLITPDTAIKHIADLAGTPVIEVSLGFAPFLKQGTYSLGSLILTDIISERNFTKNKTTKTNIKANDIMSSVFFYFAKTQSIRPILSNGVTLYSSSFDQLGVRYSVAAGSIDAEVEISRLISRQIINTLYDHNESIEIYNDASRLGLTAISSWCRSEKSNLTVVMKDLLGALRSLLQSQDNKKLAKEFVLNLGKLLAHAENNAITQIPVLMFKAKIELINAKTFEENAKEVEVLIYELKSDIQSVLLCIKKLEDSAIDQQKNDFMNRSATPANN